VVRLVKIELKLEAIKVLVYIFNFCLHIYISVEWVLIAPPF